MVSLLKCIFKYLWCLLKGAICEINSHKLHHHICVNNWIKPKDDIIIQPVFSYIL